MIKVKLLNENARLPLKAHSGDAGFDLFSSDDMVILPNSRALIGTGVSVALPVSSLKNHIYYLRIAPRSGLAVKKGIDVFAGVVDSSYRGEIKISLFNSSTEPFRIFVGDRIAQMIPTLVLDSGIELVDSLDLTFRNNSGFGSSGKN